MLCIRLRHYDAFSSGLGLRAQEIKIGPMVQYFIWFTRNILIILLAIMKKILCIRPRHYDVFSPGWGVRALHKVSK